ncbi:MAG: UDP-N-acetylmuramoyl-L-alanyl-D-glutamate--2,6-diaminopimelate ligase [Clostridia bacterium]|nr:UDP-N-acetylmuramoyl-L-alanyl-D-glutamate--2,6-diaminopimelate ligase [Clostridia bacterium]
MKLSALLKDVEVLSRFDGDREVEKVVASSKDAGEKTLFISLDVLSNKDGRYTREAREKGSLIVADGDTEDGDIAVKDAAAARSIIWRNYYDDPASSLRIHGVTGTNGKTTVTFLLRHILEKCGRRAGIIGTVANMTGDDAVASARTTPPPDELYGLLDKMRKNRLSDVCMEVSSHSLVQKRVSAVNFQSGAVTNLTRDHLDYHGNMDNYLAAKLLLVPLCENFAYNADDAYADAFKEASKVCKGKSLSYGISSQNCDIRAKNLRQSREKTAFTLCYDGRERETEINIPGRFSVYNALTAVSLAVLSGVPFDKASEHIATAGGIKGRMERIETKDGVTVVIDYAHTPDGLEKVLVALRDVKGRGKLITVFGCGGDRDKTKRPIMGEIAARLSDLVVITSDNPRTEDPYAIIDEIASGAAFSRAPILIIEDRRTAIKTALSNASKGDIVLLAGKGHETYQILKDRVVDFDEREILKEYI